jgi:nucleoside-diphosphate-sugar epimerase
MRILVTGGSGFIGSAIIKRLVEDGHDVDGLVHTASRAGIVENAGGRVVVGDLLEAGEWTAVLGEADLVISASQPVRQSEKVPVDAARRRSFYHGKMVGNLFLAAAGTGVKGVVVTYGVNGFGNRGSEWLTENSDINPTGYERTVSGAYWHIDKTSRKAKLPLLNIFTGWVYGPGGWFATMARNIKNGSMRVVGDGNNFMSLIHIDDLAAAYSAIADKMPFGERYALVDDNPVTQRELADCIAETLEVRTPKNIDISAYAGMAGDLAGESISCSCRVSGARMKKHLLHELKYPTIATGIPQAIEALGITHNEERAA